MVGVASLGGSAGMVVAFAEDIGKWWETGRPILPTRLLRNLTAFEMTPSPMRRPARFVLLLMGGLTILMGSGCERNTEVVPVVVLASGAVNAEAGRVLKPGEALREARSLQTGPDSFLAVSVLPGVVFCLDANSRGELLGARLNKKDDLVGARHARLRLLAGRAYLRVAALAGKTDVRIALPAGELRAFGEAMAEIQLDGSGAPTVTCSAGLVNVSGGIEVPAGTYSVSENGAFTLTLDASQEDARWRRVLGLREVEGIVEEIWVRQRSLRP